MNLQEATKHITNSLQKIYSQRESQNIASILMEDITALSATQRLITSTKDLTATQILKLEQNIEELLQHKPIQQIVGYTWFAGNKFYIDENVLIPRPETDELVNHIIKQHLNQTISIIDIGTGSGCIAVSLKHNLPSATVTAIDVSNKALVIAAKNAGSIGVDVNFLQLDFLEENNWNQLQPFDVIVSNPPYIKEVEQAQMHNNVLLHEPHIALFVPDNNALIFYEKIAVFAKTHLKPNGSIWLEINEALGKETATVFINNGFSAEIILDMQGKERMIKVGYRVRN
jgi:release factor glutamine methyltransferase